MTTATTVLDAQASAQLDELLAVVAQRFSDALLPPPMTARDDVRTMSLPLHEEQQSQPTTSHDDDSDGDAACRAGAYAACASRVPGLPAWRARVRRVRDDGAACARALQTLQAQLAHMRAVTAAVQQQSDALSQSASALLLRETQLECVQDGLQRTLAHFTRVHDLCHEAENNMMLSASSQRFASLLTEMRAEMAFLSAHAAYKSSRPYALRLSRALQRVLWCLTTAMTSSFADAQRTAAQSAAYARALLPQLPQTLLIMGSDDDANKSSSNNNDEEGNTAAATAAATAASMSCVASSSAVTAATTATVDTPAAAALSNVVRRFADALREVNDEFVSALRSSASLRHLLECNSLGSNGSSDGSSDGSLLSSYTGASAFGEDDSVALSSSDGSGCSGSGSGSVHMRNILAAYCDARVALTVPLLRAWLTTCYDDANNNDDNNNVAGNNNNNNNDSTTAATTTTTLVVSADALPSQHDSAVVATTTSASSMPPAQRQHDDDGDNIDASASRDGDSAMTAADMAASLPPLTQRVCALLETVIAAERAVLEQVWLRDDVVETLLPQIVARTSDSVYFVFRAHLLRLDDVVDLAATVSYIQAVWLRQSSSNDHNNSSNGSSSSSSTTSSAAVDMSGLWLRMVQDAQERLIFRASVFLRHEVARRRPTAAEVAQYLQLAPPQPTSSSSSSSSSSQHTSSSSFCLLRGVCSAMQLLHFLYPNLEFVVFAVFAAEAVATSMTLVRELVAAMTSMSSSMSSSTTHDARHGRLRALLCELLHVYYVHDELARIDANITVVERRLDLSRLRQRRLAIVQSTREAKHDVDDALRRCREAVVQEMLSLVSAPLTSVAHASSAQARAAVADMERAVAQCEALLYTYLRERVACQAALTHDAQREQQHVQQLVQSLLQPVLQRVTELRLEVAAEATV